MSDHTNIVILLDKSGSMMGRWNDTLGCLDGYVREQAELPGVCHIRLATFDAPGSYTVIYDGLASNFVRPNIFANGPSTALYDAVTSAIADAREFNITSDAEVLAVDSFLPGMEVQTEADTYHTLLVIITDGGENASRGHMTREAMQAEIETLRSEGVEVVYLAIGAEAWSEQATFGPNTVSIGTSGTSTIGAMNYLNASTVTYRSAATSNTATFFAQGNAVDDDGNIVSASDTQ